VRSLNLEYWKLYTSDKWILETVVGYKIEFTRQAKIEKRGDEIKKKIFSSKTTEPISSKLC
jgi:hypothetical protein